MDDETALEILAMALHDLWRPTVDAPHGVNLPGETDPC